MEFSLFAVFAGVAVYCIAFPKKTWKDPVKRLILILFNAVGFCCVAALYLIFYALPEGLGKDTIHFISTFYFSLIVFSCTLIVFLLILWAISKLVHLDKLRNWLEEQREWIMVAVTLLTLGICVFGFIREHKIVRTEYTVPVSVSGTDTNQSYSICLIADLHLGGGATQNTVCQAMAAIAEENPDMLLISGDLADSTTSRSDLEVFSREIGKLHPKYGIYYVSGNHDEECHYDYEPYLLQSGVVILKNSAVQLENGLIVAGQLFDNNKPLPELLSDSGIDPDSGGPILVLRHKPQDLAELDGQCDLVVCGHTHGYRYPMIFFTHTLSFDLVYGCMQMEQGTTAITTSGVSCWGFQFKFPSISEEVFLTLSPAENAAGAAKTG